MIIIILLIHLSFLLSTPIRIWPELSLQPWLVSKGLIPYRDFFDHHGFLLYYILAVIPGNLFYIGTHLLNTYLVYKLVHSKILALLFVLIMVFVSENFLWYEDAITTLYLLIYLIHTYYSLPFLVGFLAGLASFIKPTSAIVLLPLYLKNRTVLPLIVTLLMWVLIFLSYWSIGSTLELVASLFTFNQFLLRHYKGLPIGDRNILIITGSILLFSLYANVRSKTTRSILLPFSFMLISLVFLRLSYGKEHLVPIATFFVIFLDRTFSNISTTYKNILAAFVFFLSIALVRQVQYRLPIIVSERTDKNRSEEHVISSSKLISEKFYVFGDDYYLYKVNNQLPPTYFPIRFPLLEKFFPTFEQRIISDLENVGITYVISSKPLASPYENLKIIRQYIDTNFRLISENTSVMIYKRN